jgi:leucyl aminopeptidase (aminopeptidase T)
MSSKNSSLDSLYAAVAHKVLTASLSVQKGEAVTVETWNTGLQFARHVVIEARKLGAVPLTLFEDEDAYITGVKEGHKDSVGAMGKHERALLSNTDAYVFIPGPPIGPLSRKLNRKDVTASTRYNMSWYEDAAKAKLRGARLTFGYVDEDVARALGKTRSAVVAHQLKAALTDFKALGSKAKQVNTHLQDGTKAELATSGARLTFRLQGESEINDGVVDQVDVASENNVTYVPPGNVYKQIDPTSANGTLSISPFVNFAGQIKDGVLEFEKGRLVKWSSRSSAKVLDEIIEGAAEQSRVAGGLFVGLNPDLAYGYGVNNLVGGVVGIRCAGMTVTIKGATLSVNGKSIVLKGRLT